MMLANNKQNNCQKNQALRKLWNRWRGSILVEFGVAVPVLAGLIYFSLDSPRYNELNKKMYNIAYLAANLIQNISGNRTDQQITANDIQFITYSAFMPIYFGTQPFSVDGVPTKYPLGYLPALLMIYVKGDANGKAIVVWSVNCNGEEATSPDKFAYNTNDAEIPKNMKLSYTIGQSVEPKSIHPDLTIKEGEMKLIICSCIFTKDSFMYGNGQSVVNNPKKLFRFYMVPINIASGSTFFFHNYIIIKPKPGLFSKIPPFSRIVDGNQLEEEPEMEEPEIE
jgi:hypothetical protein